MIAIVKRFELAWGDPARALRWSDLSIYGLHRCAPYGNLAGMGAAWVAARGGHRVVAVSEEAIVIKTITDARQRFVRRPPDPDSVPASELAGCALRVRAHQGSGRSATCATTARIWSSSWRWGRTQGVETLAAASYKPHEQDR
jgi:hypothetical protein